MEKSLEGRVGEAKEHALVLKRAQDMESIPSRPGTQLWGPRSPPGREDAAGNSLSDGGSSEQSEFPPALTASCPARSAPTGGTLVPIGLQRGWGPD